MAEKKIDNLELWNRVEKTDPKYTKEVGYGRKFTSVNAQYQVKNATEEFGLYGSDWGIREIEYDIMRDLPHGEVLVLAKAIFAYPNGGCVRTFPISSTIKMVSWNKSKDELHLDDEWAKKIETDITTKALSKLGFNADIFLGRYDDNRYVTSMKEEFAHKPKAAEKKELSMKQYEDAMKATEEADEKKVAVIKKWLGRFNKEGRYLKLAMKGIANKESSLSKHPTVKKEENVK